MGSCASVHGKNPDSSSPSAVKFPMLFFLSSKTNKNSIPSTPVKEKPTVVDAIPQSLSINSVGYKSQVSPFNSSSLSNNGSKDEAFFDSQAWLESDCESDFYSVNGDFTPSRGSTPVHGSTTPGGFRAFSHQLNNALSQGKLPFNSGGCSSTASSPTGRRKKLADLFIESTIEDDNAAAIERQDAMNPTAGDVSPKSSSTAVSHSDANSLSSVGRSRPKIANSELDKQPHCCLPGLVPRNYSLHERKKPRTPSVTVAA